MVAATPDSPPPGRPERHGSGTREKLEESTGITMREWNI